MKKLLQLSLIAALTLSLSVTGCKKKSSEETDTDTQTSQNQNALENDFDQVATQVDNAANSNGLKKAGPVITIDTVNSTRKMTVDYGTGTLCDDGKMRSGKILVTWTGKFRDQGTTKSIAFENFVQNGNAVDNSSTKTIQNMGRDANNRMYWNISVNATVALANGSTIEWQSTRTRTWIAGESTPTVWNDDKYQITGTTTGINKKGLNYTCTITTPLTVDLSCDKRRITAGVIEMKPEGKLTRTIDYGSGECDGTVTVSIGGRTYSITRL
jgi:outer membrane murein-binding lipoprotein Lpp